jgi:galactokinase
MLSQVSEPLSGAGPGIGTSTVVSYSPGRVNLIGDHTDYNEGVALPMAVDLGTTVMFRPDGASQIFLRSSGEQQPAVVELPIDFDTAVRGGIEPRWARLVATTAALVGRSSGGSGYVRSTIPVGAGLSSSAALEVALALALGFRGDPAELAQLCQRAEQGATGVPTGLMDQLTVACSTEGHALFIDFRDLSTRQIRIPDGAEVLVVHSGQSRTLDGSEYATRHAECEAAARGLGALGRLSRRDLAGIADPLLRRRARHVVTECERVRECAAALEGGAVADAGRLMTESHRSLAEDFEVSTPLLDSLVDRLLAVPGVLGARITGAGFGGCVVAMCEPGAIEGIGRIGLTPGIPDADPSVLGKSVQRMWKVRASAGARLLPTEERVTDTPSS